MVKSNQMFLKFFCGNTNKILIRYFHDMLNSALILALICAKCVKFPLTFTE